MTAQYSASGAAKASGNSVSTITRAIRSGKISASKDAGGAWRIDPSELHRVFPLAPQPLQGFALQRDANHGKGGYPSHNEALARQVTALRDDLAEVRQRVAVAEALADERAKALEASERNLADLRRLLPPASATITPRRRWWLFG